MNNTHTKTLIQSFFSKPNYINTIIETSLQSSSNVKYCISIDIGVKNLAYCIFQINCDVLSTYIKQDCDISFNFKDCISIYDWNVVNLCEIEQVKQQCKFTGCKTKPLYMKDGFFYCNKHGKLLTSYSIPNKQFLTLDKLKIKDLETLYSSIPKTDTITKKLSKQNYIQLLESQYRTNYLEFIPKQNANDISLITLGKHLKVIFDTCIFDKQIHIDYVIIENQISPIANRMKTLQGMVAQYFIMNNVEYIDFISSSNKLKFFISKETSKTMEYKDRKHEGIDIVQRIIQGKTNTQYKGWNTWIQALNDKKKTDDLADCFLQGIWWIISSLSTKHSIFGETICSKNIPETIQNKIIDELFL